MKVKLLPSTGAAGTDRAAQFLTTYLIDEAVAIDAGSLGLADLEAQRRVTDVVLTHGHIDHVASLGPFLDNVYRTGPAPVRLHASAETLAALRRGVFNGETWPGLDELAGASPPFVRIEPLEPGRATRVAHLTIMAVPVHHTVPTLGLVVEGPGAAVAFSSDTGPTDELWRVAGHCRDLKAVLLECSFPKELREIALKSGHLTPGLFGEEMRKLAADRPVSWLAVHLKPRFRAQVAAELEASGWGVEAMEPGREYVFGERAS